MPSLDLGPRRIVYSVVKGTSRRYTYFRVKSDLSLEVVLPTRTKVDVAKAIMERSTWLLKEYDRLSRTRRVLTEHEVMYNGRLLNVSLSGGTGEQLFIDEHNGLVLARTTSSKGMRELVRRWFLKESSVYAVKKVAELAAKVGARPSRVDVREISKWGYCTRGGRLSFSWQLIALPERLREYVVLHELTHLIEFNHSAAFRERLATLCPDFRERVKELDLIAPHDKLSLG